MYNGNNFKQFTHMAILSYGQVGWRSAVAAPVSGIDADAQAFITAASITDNTQKSAINTLVTQLKTYGIWTKLKAVYPFVGGNASAHKFNLKDPRDLDAAFRLVFNGGWTHSSNGALPNGINAFADTKLLPNANLLTNSFHLSFYSRTISNASVTTYPTEIGAYNSNTQQIGLFLYRPTNPISKWGGEGYSGTAEGSTTMDSQYFGVISRTNSTTLKYLKNGTVLATQTNSDSGNRPNIAITIGKSNSLSNFSDRESAFASIGDGLSDAEAANFYTAVQTFQTTLGRHVGVPIVADTDAQAFLNAAVITDQTQASAINTLVTDLKSANIWTKMKAIYPFVGGTATTHKYNLKDPRDVDAAYRLVFSGGWTHSSTGALPNGSNAYADTKLNENNVMTLGNEHISYYSRTNISGLYGDIGVWTDSPSRGTQILSRYYYQLGDSFIGYVTDNSNSYINNSDSRGFFMSNRISNTQVKLQKNSTINTFSSNVGAKSNLNFYIGARNNTGGNLLYSPRESAFASIGDGLTDAEATAFYNAVQAYQTTLSRNV